VDAFATDPAHLAEAGYATRVKMSIQVLTFVPGYLVGIVKEAARVDKKMTSNSV
jgi:hypothetical protein